MYGATALGYAICPGVGTVVGFVVGLFGWGFVLGITLPF